MNLPEENFNVLPKDRDGVYLVLNTLCKRGGVCESFSSQGSLKRCGYYRIFGNDKWCTRAPGTVEIN